MEQLKHECGVAMIRLKKPLEHYQQKYGTWQYGLGKLYLMMEKQRNRGQEGAGLACVKMEARPGSEYMFRERAMGAGAIGEIFAAVRKQFSGIPSEKINDASYAKENLPFAGEIYMGHLRYSTTGKRALSFVHPFMRRNNWRAKNLCLCGNFNLTNVDEVFDNITAFGQHPRQESDTFILLEQLGHRLDRESERLFNEAVAQDMHGCDITHYIERNMDVRNVLNTSAHLWDGGYVICGMTGSGEMFAMRDPWGIRPAYWYEDDEILALASERPVLQTAFGLETHQVVELEPGQAIVMRATGQHSSLTQIIQPKDRQACSFERIYFSRGSDADIYEERKNLGEQLTERITEAIDGDVAHTVFSFIPNTAEVAYYGMLRGFKKALNRQKVKELYELTRDHQPSEDELKRIVGQYVRSEKVAWKDIKLRTFITEGAERNDLAAHVYDVTYGSLVPYEDNLVIIDDSIVRGTTLKESIIRILDRLHPRKIVLVSSSPQVRYPDYYGIDMARMNEFIAFRAAIELLIERGDWGRIDDVYRLCVGQRYLPKEQMQNYVKKIYEPFTDEDISKKMVEMLRPEGITTPIEIVYQSLEGLHEACPQHRGDWYFSGDYPTPGGVKLVNKAFIEYYENVYKKIV